MKMIQMETTTIQEQRKINRQQNNQIMSSDYSISEIDLTNQPVHVLLALKDKVESQLSKVNSFKLKDSDLVLEYQVKLRSKDGIIAVNEGSSRLNSIMNKRLIVEAPRRFEAEFQHQIFEPVYAEAMALFDESSLNENSLENIKQQIGTYDTNSLQGLPVSIIR